MQFVQVKHNIPTFCQATYQYSNKKHLKTRETTHYCIYNIIKNNAIKIYMHNNLIFPPDTLIHLVMTGFDVDTRYTKTFRTLRNAMSI